MTANNVIVVIDDERMVQATLSAVLERNGYQVYSAYAAAAGLEKVREAKPDLVLLDLGLPDADGLDVLRKLREEHPGLPVMILTANDTISNAIESIKLGAFHFLSKPYAAEELLSLCGRALEQRDLVRQKESLTRKNEQLEERLRVAEEQLRPVATSRRMREVEQLLSRIAPSEANLLLTGESGVGKEVYAGEVHRLSQRSAAPMVKLNCGAFPANLIEAELFGYAKGAFTGATSAFPGMLAQANGGTLFLDEITEAVDIQVRLLRALETSAITRVGGAEQVKVDVRIVAATSRRVDEAVAAGKLREDLFYRLNVFPIRLPPLRERGDDIELLADNVLATLNREAGTAKHFTRACLDRLHRHSWPGNVRELQNVIRRAFILAEGDVGVDSLPLEVNEQLSATSLVMRVGTPVAEVEKRLILATLEHCDGDKKKAADLLKISLKTLYNRLNEYKPA